MRSAVTNKNALSGRPEKWQRDKESVILNIAAEIGHSYTVPSTLVYCCIIHAHYSA